MALFLRRFIGALVLDPSAYEDIEADRSAMAQSLAVVLLASAGGGVAAVGLGLLGVGGFIAGAVMVLGAWLVWITVVSVIGTFELGEPDTRSSTTELVRTMGFATAPGVFLAFAAMRAAAPIVFTIVFLWLTAATVVAVRQALDYRSTSRAVLVCAGGWLLAAGVMGFIAALLTRELG